MARDGSSEDAQPKARIDVIYPGPTSDFETAFGTFLEGLPRTRPRILVEQTASPAPSAPAPQSLEWARQKLAELEAEPEALSDYLEAQEPGPQLAQFLEALDLDTVDDYCLVEVVAAYKRMESWAAAGAMAINRPIRFMILTARASVNTSRTMARAMAMPAAAPTPCRKRAASITSMLSASKTMMHATR